MGRGGLLARGTWEGGGGRWRGSGRAHLQHVVGGVVQQQHQRANAQQVRAVGEGDEGDGHKVVCHLLLEILWETTGHRQDRAEQALSGLVGLRTQCTPCLLPEAPGDLQVWGEPIPPCPRLGPDSPRTPLP